MFQKFTNLLKKAASTLTAFAVVVSVMPMQMAFADGDLTVTYNLPGGFVSGQFHHNVETLGGVILGGASGNGTINNIPDGNYQLRVDTMPAGCSVTNVPHPIPFTINNGQTTPITINITCGGGGAGTGDLTVTYNLPAGVTSGQFHHNVETLAGVVVGGASGNGTINSITPGNYQLRVDTLPAGCLVVNAPHPIPFTITNGVTTSVTINIGGATCGTGAGTGDLTVTYNLPGGLGLTSGQFHHNVETLAGAVVGGGSGDGTINNLNVGNYQLNVDVLPAGCIVTNAPHPIPFTINNGQTTTVTVNIGNAGGCNGGGPGPGVPAFIVSPTGGLVTTEAGGTATFTVALNTLPTADVSITLTSSDLTEGTVSPATLTFTNANGTTAQTVTITGVDDTVADGAIAYTIITGTATSADGNYNGVDPANVSVVNNDNDGGSNGGGGGRRRDRAPVIVFLYNQQTVTSVDLIAGEPASITVIATDPRNFGVILSLLTDPSADDTSPATFTVLNQEASSVTGTLTWTPGNDSVGTNPFVFHATNNFDVTEETLPITVRVGANGTGGGSGGGGTGEGGSSLFDTEKFEKCQYKDNSTESVVYLCMLGIIDPPNDSKDYDGNSKDFKYFGKDPITRAAFTKIMVNITYEHSAIERVAALILKNTYFPFPDVEPIAWFSKFISVAALDNHVHGYPHNGLFVPWNMIEISEATKILFNTAAHDNAKIKKDLEKASKDAEDPWFMRFALLAYAYGGYTPKLDQDPGVIYSKTLTRQQAADIIYTTILNAGIETKGKLSELKQQLTTMQEPVEVL